VFSEIDASLAEGFFHEAEGWVIFVVALVILVAVHQALNFIYRRLHPEPTISSGPNFPPETNGPKEQGLA
jgi:hypothetical protein